jgi:hypothetical protein
MLHFQYRLPPPSFFPLFVLVSRHKCASLSLCVSCQEISPSFLSVFTKVKKKREQRNVTREILKGLGKGKGGEVTKEHKRLN